MAVNVALASYGASAYKGKDGSHASSAPSVIDDNPTTYEAGSVPCYDGASFCIELPQAETIMAVGWLQSGTALYRSTHIQVSWSNNHTDWTMILDTDVLSDDEEVAITPTLARYWKFVSTAGGNSAWRAYTLELWIDQYVEPTPPVGKLQDDLMQKIGSRYPEVLTPWYLLQGAPTNMDPITGLATICLWNNWLLNEILREVLALGGGGGGECLFSDTAILAAIAALDGVVDSGISAIALNDNANLSTIMAKLGPSATSLEDQIAEGVQDGLDATFARGTDVISAVSGAQTHIETNDNSNTSGLVGTINAARDHVEADAATKYAALTSTVTDGLAQQTIDLAGPLATTHDNLAAGINALVGDVAEVLSAVQDIPTPSNPAVLYPGPDGVILGSEATVNGSDWVDAATYGVAGAMDGILVEVVSGSPRVTDRTVQGVTNYRYAGWLAFADEEDWLDEPQYLNLETRAYVPLHLSGPKQVLVAGTLGVSVKVTPWVLVRP